MGCDQKFHRQSTTLSTRHVTQTAKLVTPLKNPPTSFSDLVLSENIKVHSFAVLGWTPDQQIDQLIKCFPDLYEELYEKKPDL